MIIDKKVSKNIRNQGRNWGITISGIDNNICNEQNISYDKELIKELIEEKIKKNEKNLSKYAIALEHHVDKTYHAHLFLNYSHSLESSLDTKRYEYILNIHPNITKLIDKYKWLFYITKEDKNVLANFDINQMLKSSSKYLDLVLRDNHEIFKDKCLLGFKYDKKIENYLKDFNEHNKNRILKNKKKVNFSKSLEAWLAEKDIKLNDALLFKYTIIISELNICLSNSRKFKSLNLYLWSKRPSIGKSSFLNILRDKLKTYTFPKDKWFSNYESNVYDVILWDESKLYLHDISDLNLFLEGSYVSLNVKGGRTEKFDNPLIIMCSNIPLKKQINLKFKNDVEMFETYIKTMEVRITEIEFKDDENLFQLNDYISNSLIPL